MDLDDTTDRVLPGPAADGDLLDRVRDFLRGFERRQAQRVVELPGGFAVLSPRSAASHDHNKLCFRDGVEAPEALRLADDVLGGAGLSHRLVVVDDDEVGATFAEPFRRAGYTHDVELIMVERGSGTAGELRRPVVVEPVTADDLADMERDGWRGALPDASPEAVEQLVGRRRARTGAADGVVFLAVRDGAEVVARADLYLDPAVGLAQIEDVLTDEAHRNRGYAQALLGDATRRAHEAGCATRFLLAAADDWPQVLYGRLGYTVIGSRHLFSRAD
ncbi:GNAT family N-acetyltransferase [Promicromonospora sukumoe]|uniref:GNAT family N-acetyltransferase n=1 Tax=Promicromonospora sukumoe TaxID=88382 RepID=UPI00036005F3|nr:GNAT family N-acetyltransferase [Promicromonospora sukumoe]